MTHWDGCETEHAACAIHRLVAALDAAEALATEVEDFVRTGRNFEMLSDAVRAFRAAMEGK